MDASARARTSRSAFGKRGSGVRVPLPAPVFGYEKAAQGESQMNEETPCPNCGQPVADDSGSCGRCGHLLGDPHEGPDQPEPSAPDVGADELPDLGAESRRLHPLNPPALALAR